MSGYSTNQYQSRAARKGRDQGRARGSNDDQKAVLESQAAQIEELKQQLESMKAESAYKWSGSWWGTGDNWSSNWWSSKWDQKEWNGETTLSGSEAAASAAAEETESGTEIVCLHRPCLQKKKNSSK